jgi:hypothetical protein
MEKMEILLLMKPKALAVLEDQEVLLENPVVAAVAEVPLSMPEETAGMEIASEAQELQELTDRQDLEAAVAVEPVQVLVTKREPTAVTVETVRLSYIGPHLHKKNLAWGSASLSPYLRGPLPLYRAIYSILS